jgi:hypothetical protein
MRILPAGQEYCGAARLGRRLKGWLAVLVVLLVCGSAGAEVSAHAEGAAPAGVKIYDLPAEVRSAHYRVRLNGREAAVMHAATEYYLVNFDTDGPVEVAVTAEDPHFWDAGVEIQPMRLGIRPRREGATIRFLISGPEKLTITRPGDHFADADMLFLFANSMDRSGITAASTGVRYYGPGIHRENIDAHSGDRIYLDGAAVVFGALNLWQVENVRVFGRGTVIYDGPQDPHTDQGWMHRPNWHCIGMDHARSIEVDGITCITRSRSWQVQMLDSKHIGFYNVKVIGGNANDANQDGMDWLGGGDTTVRNSFFRAADDVFALQGNWDGYEHAQMTRVGHNVANITIEDSIVSTSISNTVRVGWPQKTFNSAHFRMSDVDVIHTGFGACKIPFALLELWADPDGYGSHRDYRFHDIRMEDWYSLFQLRQAAPQVRDISFSGVWAMDGAAMVAPVAKGNLAGVELHDASIQGFRDASIGVEDGAEAPRVEASPLGKPFRYTDGWLRPGQEVAFTAEQPAEAGRRFEWSFGDGARAEGRVVRHRFPDTMGTLLDGSGRFRVLLHVTDGGNGRPEAWKEEKDAWISEPVVIAAEMAPAYRDAASPKDSGRVVEEERFIQVPADGGYTFTWLTSAQGWLRIDDLAPVATPTARHQVCGSTGDAVEPVRTSVALARGWHRILVERDSSVENMDAAGAGLLLWEGPGVERQRVPGESLSAAAP